MHPGKTLTTKIPFLLVVMIFCFGIAPGCMAPYWQPVCRHQAVYAAITVGEDMPVRIARGVTDSGKWHVQAQGLIAGQWRWLDVSRGWVCVCEQDGFYPVEYYTLQEYFNKNFGATR